MNAVSQTLTSQPRAARPSSQVLSELTFVLHDPLLAAFVNNIWMRRRLNKRPQTIWGEDGMTDLAMIAEDPAGADANPLSGTKG